jgi:hypothetical protein
MLQWRKKRVTGSSLPVPGARGDPCAAPFRFGAKVNDLLSLITCVAAVMGRCFRRDDEERL